MGIETILIADDEALSRDFLVEAVRTLGYEAIAAEDGEQAFAAFQKESPDLVISDLKMPGIDGLELLSRIRQISAEIPFILLTAHGTVESAVAAMKNGASDFLLKPVATDALEVSLRRVQKDSKMRRENEYLRKEIQGEREFVGESAAIGAVLREAEKVARTKATVLVTGESGTGKERIAHLIHYASPRANGPFIRVNCAALSETLLESELFGHERGAFTGAVQKREGRFELADGGTLLLDEIGEIPMSLQAKLLRVLEEEEFERVGGTKTLRVDVRVIATTNRDLASEARKGKFREDLYYRLNVVPLTIPPLRARREDVSLLAKHFLERFHVKYGSLAERFSAEAERALMAYDWPGNVRELENLVQRLVVRDSGQEIGAEDFAKDLDETRVRSIGAEAEDPAGIVKTLTGRSLFDIEKDVILNTLAATGGNKTEAARILGVTARTLSNKMKLYREMQTLSGERS